MIASKGHYYNYDKVVTTVNDIPETRNTSLRVSDYYNEPSPDRRRYNCKSTTVFNAIRVYEAN